MRSFGIWLIVSSIRLFSFAYSCLPRVIQWGASQSLFHLYWNILRQRRFTVYRNIRIVFPMWSKAETYLFAQDAVRWMAYHLTRFLLIPSLRTKDLNHRFCFHGLESLEKAKAQGRGVLLLSCHMGNPDLGLNGLALAGEKIWVISKKFSSGFANEVWFKLRSRPGLNFIAAHGRETTYQIFKALSLNESVLFVTDQFMGPPYGIPTSFFGKVTGTAYGLARFFIKSKAPIVPCYCVEDDKGVCHIYFDNPIWPKPELLEVQDESREQQTTRLVELFNQRVEQMILQDPVHWMWIHRRWKRWEIR